MSLEEQSLTQMRSEFSNILGTNFTLSTKHYGSSFALIDTTDLIWEDTAYVGITAGDDISNIIDNPAFFTDSGWVKGSGWTIGGGGFAECDGSQAAPTPLKQLNKLTEFCLYRIKLDYTKTAGNIWVLFDGTLNSQTGNLGSSGFDGVLRAFSDSDFVIYGDADLEAEVNNVKVQLVNPLDSNKFDAIVFCPYDYNVNVGDFFEVNSIVYLVYKIEINLDHKKVYCLHL